MSAAADQLARPADVHEAIGTVDLSSVAARAARTSIAPPKPKRSSVATALRLMAPALDEGDNGVPASPLGRRMSTRRHEAEPLLRELPPLEPEQSRSGVGSSKHSVLPTSASSRGSVFEVGAHDSDGEEGGVADGSETLESEEYTLQVEAAIAASQPLPPSIKEWAFDVWAIPENTMPGAMVSLMHSQDALVPLRVPIKPVLRLLSSIRDRYWKQNAFHNSYHGLHVAQATALLLDKTGLNKVLPDVERFALLLAAFSHDVDHPGVGNGYLTGVSDELAVQYANESILENHHAALTLAMMAGHSILPQRDVSTSSEVVAAAVTSAREAEAGGSSSPIGSGAAGNSTEEERTHHSGHSRTASNSSSGSTISGSTTDVLSHFTPAQQRRIRRVVTAAILATDMSKHATVVIPAVKALDLPLIMNSVSPASSSSSASSSASLPVLDEESLEKARDSIHGILLHCADLTGQVLPWDISSRWSDGVVAEFRAQAALEISAKLTPTAHMHGLHTNKAVAKLQAGFCDFVLAPLWKAMAEKFPVLTDRVEQLEDNSQRFKAIIKEATEAEEKAASSTAATPAEAKP